MQSHCLCIWCWIRVDNPQVSTKEELKWKRMKSSKNPGGHTRVHICLLSSPTSMVPTSMVQVASRRACHLCHGADCAPAPWSGEVEGQAAGWYHQVGKLAQQRRVQGTMVPTTLAFLPSVKINLPLSLFKRHSNLSCSQLSLGAKGTYGKSSSAELSGNNTESCRHRDPVRADCTHTYTDRHTCGCAYVYVCVHMSVHFWYWSLWCFPG